MPAEVIAQFKQETGIQVEVSLSNNEEIISKLRATGGAGFDLAQPSQDRIVSAQQEFRIYRPFDLSKVKVDEFMPDLLETVKKNASLDGKLYALPYVWGAEGLVVELQARQDQRLHRPVPARIKGKTTVRLRRPDADGLRLRARQGSRSRSTATPRPTRRSWSRSGSTLTDCKANLRFFYDNKDQLLNGMRSGEIVAAMVVGFGRLEAQSREPGHQVRQSEVRARSPGSIPSRCRRAAATRPAPTPGSTSRCGPDIAAKIARSIGNFTASKGAER